MRAIFKYSEKKPFPSTIEIRRPIVAFLMICMVLMLMMHLVLAQYFNFALLFCVFLIQPYLYSEKITIWPGRLEVTRGLGPLAHTQRYNLNNISELAPQQTASETQRGFFNTEALSFKYEERTKKILGGGTKSDAQKCAQWIEAAQTGQH